MLGKMLNARRMRKGFGQRGFAKHTRTADGNACVCQTSWETDLKH
jgi:hypothetical protein